MPFSGFRFCYVVTNPFHTVKGGDFDATVTADGRYRVGQK